MNKLIRRMGLVPSALDLWIAVMVLLHAFGKTIPAFVWVLFGLEALLVINAAIKEQRDPL